MSETLAKAVCSEVSKEIVKIVPQLDDYLCPVCFNISYKPVRLTCGHVFCIRCMIRMQRAQNKFCPLCRNDVIMHADSGEWSRFFVCGFQTLYSTLKLTLTANIDVSLMRFLQSYFPKETKVKQKENEIAIGVDLYGESYTDAKCVVM
jgi:E3 ubiquitin-protein ligase BAH